MKDKTITLTVHEFRKNIKSSLDYCIEGGVVIVDRMGQKFMLTSMGRDVDIMFASTPAGKNGFYKLGEKPDELNVLTPEKNTAGASHPDLPTIPARIKNPDTPVRTDDEWQEAEGLERACCKLKKPCQHWEFNSNSEVWQNSLSGRQKGVEQ